MRLKKPNLFIIGAMKSGTTSLHNYLGAHPDIFMSELKEPTYFNDRDELLRIWPQRAERGIWTEDAYLELFANVGDEKIIGESSTTYSKIPEIGGVVQRIAAFGPNARFIYIMRDPCQRTVSHYWNNVVMYLESKDIYDAITSDPQYLNTSHYAMQLAPYLEAFGADRIKALTFESMLENPVATVREIYAWLGVDPDFVCKDIGKNFNGTPDEIVPEKISTVYERIKNSALMTHVRAALPAGVRAKIRQTLRPTKSLGREEQDYTRVFEYLRSRQQGETRQLEQLLGRQFPEWATLHGTGGNVYLPG